MEDKMDIETIKNLLKNFVENSENKKQMSINIYNKIWNEIQSIDYEIGETKKNE